ncbi:MAG: aldehyde-activating protein [Hirschia sp.]|mgnify:CR=1 FL=1|nr:aldehyde-activating protein [Hirschia sp.]MBF19645.1 aldehyde-activating protein [Hirschia sp.]
MSEPVTEPVTGGCLCGACTYSTEAQPLNIRACHCRMCRKVTGGAVYARVSVPLDKTDWKGPVGWYQSSPELRRGFCKQCGASLFSERAKDNAIGLTFGTLDHPERFRPEAQIWRSSGLSWIELSEDITCHDQGYV